MVKTIFLSLALVIAVVIIAIIVMIAFFPPKPISMLETVASPFQSLDFSKLPHLLYYTARDGSTLVYREYTVQRPKKIVVLVHGSSASGTSMHPLAEYLRNEGMTVYVPDIRGHGGSGRKGDIDYIGQLEDDLEDFANRVIRGHDAVLVGLSSGGGFALRFAAEPRQKLFARYILLSPYTGYDSPTVKPDSGGWVSVSTPRIIGLSLLGPVGEKLFGYLPVIRYAIDPHTAQYQTAWYSFRLLQNFAPHSDYRADIASARQPLRVLVGDKDELFNANEFNKLFTGINPAITVTLVPGVGHITLTTDKKGMAAVVKALREQ